MVGTMGWRTHLRLPGRATIRRVVVMSSGVVEESLWGLEQTAVALVVQRRTAEMVVLGATAVGTGTTEATDQTAIAGPAGTTATRPLVDMALHQPPRHRCNSHPRQQQHRHQQQRGIHREDVISMQPSSGVIAMMRTDPIRPFHDQAVTHPLDPATTTISHPLRQHIQDQLGGHRTLVPQHQGDLTVRMKDPGGEKCPNRPRQIQQLEPQEQLKARIRNRTWLLNLRASDCRHQPRPRDLDHPTAPKVRMSPRNGSWPFRIRMMMVSLPHRKRPADTQRRLCSPPRALLHPRLGTGLKYRTTTCIFWSCTTFQRQSKLHI